MEKKQLRLRVSGAGVSNRWSVRLSNGLSVCPRICKTPDVQMSGHRRLCGCHGLAVLSPAGLPCGARQRKDGQTLFVGPSTACDRLAVLSPACHACMDVWMMTGVRPLWSGRPFSGRPCMHCRPEKGWTDTLCSDLLPPGSVWPSFLRPENMQSRPEKEWTDTLRQTFHPLRRSSRSLSACCTCTDVLMTTKAPLLWSGRPLSGRLCACCRPEKGWTDTPCLTFYRVYRSGRPFSGRQYIHSRPEHRQTLFVCPCLRRDHRGRLPTSVRCAAGLSQIKKHSNRACRHNKPW